MSEETTTKQNLEAVQRRSLQREWLTEWTMQRLAETKAMPKYEEQLEAILGEFGPKSGYEYALNRTQASKRVTRVRRMVDFVIEGNKDRIRATLGGFLDELRESNLEPRITNVKTDKNGKVVFERYEIEAGEARLCTAELIKLFGVAAPEKVNVKDTTGPDGDEMAGWTPEQIEAFARGATDAKPD